MALVTVAGAQNTSAGPSDRPRGPDCSALLTCAARSAGGHLDATDGACPGSAAASSTSVRRDDLRAVHGAVHASDRPVRAWSCEGGSSGRPKRVVHVANQLARAVMQGNTP